MCDGTGMADHGWKGWLDIPPLRFPDVERRGGDWKDLSHRLNDALPRVSFFPKPSFRQVMRIPEHPINVTEIQMVVHVGTHVDAPRHFYLDGPAFHEIPPERLFGAGVVLRIAARPHQVITAADLAACAVDVLPGDIVVLDTGWAQYFGQDKYEEHPALSTDAAQWLVDKRVKLLGVDFATPDLAVRLRKPGFNWPVHHILLARGVLVSEHLTNVSSLPAGRAEFVFSALNIEGSDGAPARVLGRALT
jgi:arylformamidase